MRQEDDAPLYLYLFVTELEMSFILIQKKGKSEKTVYFVNKFFKGAKERYQNIEKLEVTVLITTRKLKPYFQGHKLMVIINNMIRQIM